MHIQTASTTAATMTYPSLPASPTLTNPDMILPYGEYDSTPSPPQHAFRPSSSGDEWRSSRPSDLQFSIGPPHAPLGTITPTTPIIYGNGTMLSDIGEVTEAESTVGRRLPGPAERRMLKQQAQASSVRSSPTLGYNSILKRSMGSHGRQISMESTSTLTSEVHGTELFKDFDDGVSVDDINFQGDDEGSVADSYSEEVIASETQRLSRRDGSMGRDEDINSSAALSRRAEQILQNAKKRLNNMEDNLTRARSSLYTTPSGSQSSIHSITPSPPQNNQTVVPQLGAHPMKLHQLYAHPASPNRSPGHSRVYSENSISSSLRTTPFVVRSASAAARYVGKSGFESSQRSPPAHHGSDNAREESRRHGITPPLSKASPPHGVQLEPLSEDNVVPEFEADRASIKSNMEEGLPTLSGDQRGLARSASSMQMRDLRDQMHDLKGRLSVLRDRARDDTMKRRSLQSLRTPSPFTAAEQWHNPSKNYGEDGLSPDAEVAHPAWNEGTRQTRDHTSSENLLVVGQSSTGQVPEYASSEVISVYEDVSEDHHATDGFDSSHEPPISEIEKRYDVAADVDQQEDLIDDNGNDYNDEIVKREELDGYESDASLYHDSFAIPISHEDREDAFDYEHFFLHSAMGTISQQRHGRRDSIGSFSSEDSVETARGLNNVSERPALGHLRSESTDSVDTMDSFATATEDLAAEINDEEGHDNYAVQHVAAPHLRSITPVTDKRGTFGSPVKNGLQNGDQSTQDETSRPSSVIHDGNESNGNRINQTSLGTAHYSRSFPLVNKPNGQKSSTPGTPSSDQNESALNEPEIFIEGRSTDIREHLQSSPVHMLTRDDQILVERLVASLGRCVLGLQEAGRSSYEGRVWRRRLDAARRTLEGQEGAI